MAGITLEVEGKIPSPDSWAKEADGFARLLHNHPVEAGILFICLCIILILIPGGIGPALAKYRGAERQQEKKRVKDIENLTLGMSKRAKRRARGKEKNKP